MGVVAAAITVARGDEGIDSNGGEVAEEVWGRDTGVDGRDARAAAVVAAVSMGTSEEPTASEGTAASVGVTSSERLAAGAGGGHDVCGRTADEDSGSGDSSGGDVDGDVRGRLSPPAGPLPAAGAAAPRCVGARPNHADSGRQPATSVATSGCDADASPVGEASDGVMGVHDKLVAAAFELVTAVAMAVSGGVAGSSHTANAAAEGSTTGERGCSHAVDVAVIVRRTNE